MKKVCSMVFSGLVVAAFVLVVGMQFCLAASSGKMTISGLSVNDQNVIVYASQYEAFNGQECVATDWWWPTGTQYAFWFPKSGNDQLYIHFMSAYHNRTPVWIHGTIYETLGWGNGVRCRINLPMGATMGR